MKRLRAILNAFDAADVPVIVFLLGLALVWYGGELIHDGAGTVWVGLILIIYVKPLRSWVTKERD